MNKLIDQGAIGQNKSHLKEGTATATVVLKMKGDFAEDKASRLASGYQRKHQYDEDREPTIANAKRLWEQDASLTKKQILEQIKDLQCDVNWKGSSDTRWGWIKGAAADGKLTIPLHVQKPGRPRS